MSDVLTPAALAMFMLEGLKELWRAFTKDPFYQFPPKVVAVLLVILNYVAVLGLALLMVGDYQFPTDWESSLRALLVAILTTVVSSALYVTGLRPFRVFAREFRATQNNVKNFKKMKK